MRGVIQDKVYYKKENENQKLRAFGGAWTVNLDDVKLTTVDKIVYQTISATYEIDTITAYAKGTIRFFQGEKKLIVPLKYWRKT